MALLLRGGHVDGEVGVVGKDGREINGRRTSRSWQEEVSEGKLRKEEERSRKKAYP